MRFILAVVFATFASVVSGQTASVSLGGSASGSGSTSTSGGSASGSGSGSGSLVSTLPSSVVSTAGGLVTSILVAGTSIPAGAFTLVGSTLTSVQSTVDSLGLGPAVAAAPGTIEGLALGVAGLVSAGASSLTLTLAAPTSTVFDVFTSTVPGSVGTLLASVPIGTSLPPLPIAPPALPIVSSLPLPPIPTVASLLPIVSTVLASTLSTVTGLLGGLTGSLLGGSLLGGSVPVTVSPGVIGSIVVPLTSATHSVTVLVDGNILNILNLTVSFHQ